MFHDDSYTEWKQSIRNFLATKYSPAPILTRCALSIDLYAPNKPAGDLDNLAGGLMDAIQPPRAKGDVRAQRSLEAAVSIEQRLAAAPGCLIGDDKQVVELSIRWVPSKVRGIALRLEPR